MVISPGDQLFFMGVRMARKMINQINNPQCINQSAIKMVCVPTIKHSTAQMYPNAPMNSMCVPFLRSKATDKATDRRATGPALTPSIVTNTSVHISDPLAQQGYTHLLCIKYMRGKSSSNMLYNTLIDCREVIVAQHLLSSILNFE